MNDLTQICDLCRTKIRAGEKYGILTFNIETLTPSTEYPEGMIEVHHSDVVNTFCINCASKYNAESVKQFLD